MGPSVLPPFMVEVTALRNVSLPSGCRRGHEVTPARPRGSIADILAVRYSPDVVASSKVDVVANQPLTRRARLVQNFSSTNSESALKESSHETVLLRLGAPTG